MEEIKPVVTEKKELQPRNGSIWFAFFWRFKISRCCRKNIKKNSLGYAFAKLMLLNESFIEQKRPAVTRKSSFEYRNKPMIITPFGNLRRPEIWRTDRKKKRFCDWINLLKCNAWMGALIVLIKPAVTEKQQNYFDYKSKLLAVLEKWAIRNLIK